MTVTILPFPILRRHGFIQKQAAHAACMNPNAAARYIEYQIQVQVQRDAMRRRGLGRRRYESKLAYGLGASTYTFSTMNACIAAERALEMLRDALADTTRPRAPGE